MGQMRTMSGYAEAITHRDETIVQLKGKIEAQQDELRQVQNRLAELQQQVQTLPQPQIMAGWSEGLNQRLQQFEAAILAHERTLSTQSQISESAKDLRMKLMESLNSQGAMRNEMDLLRADHIRTHEALSTLMNQVDAAVP